jgi:hypothetical protein
MQQQVMQRVWNVLHWGKNVSALVCLFGCETQDSKHTLQTEKIYKIKSPIRMACQSLYKNFKTGGCSVLFCTQLMRTADKNFYLLHWLMVPVVKIIR